MVTKEDRDMLDNIIGKYYDLETIGTNTALEYVSMNPKDLRQSKLKKYRHVKLVNINGLGIGQAYFVTDDGFYLLLPWCYIISMTPSKTNHEKVGNKMQLSDTATMMNSDDYKERFRAEYAQLVNRYYGLRRMLEKWDNGTLEFEPTCPRSTYNMQTKAMEDYIAVLEARAVMEEVDLEDM